MNKEKVIILFSGGTDSSLLLEIAENLNMQVLCILYDYGQKHIAELEKARAICTKKEVEFIELKVPIDARSKLTHDTVQYEGVSEWHVPGRNLIFIALAASVAESRGISKIWYGANYADRDHLFPDCYQEWVYKVNEVLAINGSMKITVEAPLLGFTKPLIEAMAFDGFGINKENIFSGYGNA